MVLDESTFLIVLVLSCSYCVESVKMLKVFGKEVMFANTDWVAKKKPDEKLFICCMILTETINEGDMKQF